MILASIGARALNRDPAPWVYPDGTRHADTTDPAHDLPLPDPAHVEYAPRSEFTPTTHHPANPILWDMRLAHDAHDPWGTYISWGIAVCAAVEYLGGPVPERMGFRAGAYGAEGILAERSWEVEAVVRALDLGEYPDEEDGEPVLYAGDDGALAIAEHAMRVLDRLLEAVPEADRY
jgi:hypothetical protein